MTVQSPTQVPLINANIYMATEEPQKGSNISGFANFYIATPENKPIGGLFGLIASVFFRAPQVGDVVYIEPDTNL